MNSFNSSAFLNRALQISNEAEFEQLAMELFSYQMTEVKVYADYLKFLRIDTNEIKNYHQIPCIPVTFFKTHEITDQKNTPNFYFSSSGTTGQMNSKHFVPDLTIYDESLIKGFELFYGNSNQYCFLALLPTYLEKEGSSLVYMMEKLMRKGNHPESGFYLHNHNELNQKIQTLQHKGDKIFLIGVTYALLDFFEKFPQQLINTILLETGGMKGKRKELVKAELHEILKAKSGISLIHSEYGMTELLSQAYSKGNGIFQTPPWMNIKIHDLYDPFQILPDGQTGSINVIDLANIHSCAFLSTQDLGRIVNVKQFEVLGRSDNSDIRGCNLMVD